MHRMKIQTQDLYEWFLVLFLSQGFIATGCRFVLDKFGLIELAGTATAIIMYIPLITAVAANLKNCLHEVKFILIYALFGLLFIVNFMVHPEYEEYYFRPVYNVWDAIFHPVHGSLIALLAFSLVKDSKKIKRDLYIGSYLILVQQLYSLLLARKNGYWETYNAQGEMEKYTYSLVFGYIMSFCMINFVLHFLEHRSWYDAALAVFSFVLIFAEGSRGPLICIACFAILYFLVKVDTLSLAKKTMICVLIAAVIVVLICSWRYILNGVILLLNGLDIESRTLTMLLEGSIASDNGRDRIYEISWELIRNQSIFGSGPYGSRPAIADEFYWGYPHSIVLEFLIDYGWVMGSLLLVLLVYQIVSTFRNADEDMKMVMCVMVAVCAKLLLSDTYWGYSYFWGMLGCIWANKIILRKRLKKEAIGKTSQDKFDCC